MISDIISDNVINMINEILQYCDGSGCEDCHCDSPYGILKIKGIINLVGLHLKIIGEMNLFRPTEEQLNYFNNVNWNEKAFEFIKIRIKEERWECKCIEI